MKINHQKISSLIFIDVHWLHRFYRFSSILSSFLVLFKFQQKEVMDEKMDNLVLSTGLIMWIGHRKQIRKLTLRALGRRANARNASFCIFLQWPIHIVNPVDKTKLSCYTCHRHNTTVSFETYPSGQEISFVRSKKKRNSKKTFRNRPFLLVHFVFTIQIMWWYLGDLICMYCF